MRLVVDTNVVVTAVRSPRGASAELLRRIRHGDIVMLATVALFFEYEAVVTRAEHLAAAGVTRSEAENMINLLARFAEPVQPHFLWRPTLRDADDDMVLEAAVNGRAAAIVTFNVRHFAAEAIRFGVESLTPAEILRRF